MADIEIPEIQPADNNSTNNLDNHADSNTVSDNTNNSIQENFTAPPLK